MFRGWNRRIRWRVAAGLAALYAFCVLLPSAALAVTHVAAHCLTGSNGASHVHRAIEKTPDRDHAAPHSHAGNAQHEHSHDGAPHQHEKADDTSHGGNCCGLFCLSAISQDGGSFPAVVFAVAKDSPVLADALAGRVPDRINRPPIR